MKNLFILLITLFFITSCNKDNCASKQNEINEKANIQIELCKKNIPIDYRKIDAINNKRYRDLLNACD